MDPTDLDALVAAAHAGDGAAFGLIWRATAGPVLGYFRAHGCRDAEDLTSETFLAAFNRMEAFSGDGAAFRSWLFTIAHHKRVDDVRRRTRRPDPVPYEPELDARTTSLSQDPSALGGAEVIGLLAALPADQREVLTLRFVADLSLEQVAVTLERSVGAVKSLQHRALESARRRAQDHDGAPRPEPRAQRQPGESASAAVPPSPAQTMTEA